MAGPATTPGVFTGVYRSTDSGANFSTRSTTPNILGYSSTGSDDIDQAWYDLAIAVALDNTSKLYTGGINVWKSINAGTTMTNVSQWVFGGTEYTHADIHALEYNPLNDYLYCGSDGGIFQSSDGGDSWTNISTGLANMQFYKIAGKESNSNLLVGGTQDNGSNK